MLEVGDFLIPGDRKADINNNINLVREDAAGTLRTTTSLGTVLMQVTTIAVHTIETIETTITMMEIAIPVEVVDTTPDNAQAIDQADTLMVEIRDTEHITQN